VAARFVIALCGSGSFALYNMQMASNSAANGDRYVCIATTRTSSERKSFLSIQHFGQSQVSLFVSRIYTTLPSLRRHSKPMAHRPVYNANSNMHNFHKEISLHHVSWADSTLNRPGHKKFSFSGQKKIWNFRTFFRTSESQKRDFLSFRAHITSERLELRLK